MPRPGVFVRLGRRRSLTRFFVGEGPESGPIRLDRSRVYILPTAHGFALGVLLFAMLVGSLNFHNSLGLLLSFLLGSLSFVAILHTWSNLAGLAFHVGRVEPVFAGDLAHFTLRIENAGGRPRFAVQVRPHGGATFQRADVPAEGAAVSLSIPTSCRGRLPLGRFVVETRFPLCLFRAWAHLEFHRGCTVYPRPGPPSPLPTADAQAAAQTGGHGRGDDEFSGLRAYVPGDAPRTLHWKASARTGDLLVKQFERGTAGELRLDWESLPDADPEARLSQLCRWALDAHRAALVWGLRLPGVEFAPSRGEEHLHRCLSALALFEL